MLGVHEVYRVTGHEPYRDHVAAWLDHHIGRGYEIWSSDTCAPAALAVLLHDETGEERYRQVVDEALRYLSDVALRTEAGGINHLGAVSLLGPSVWVDSLFMFGNLLTRWGELADDAAALAEQADQLGIFAEQLQGDGGLFLHARGAAYTLDDNVFWGRGNGWATAAGFDHLRVRRNRKEDAVEVASLLRRQVAAVLPLQDPDTGLWWTVLNRPGESYLETSATALFAFGLARGWRYGWLEDEVLPAVRLAVAGLKSRVTRDADGSPVVTGTSGPTSPGTFDYYAGIAQEDDLPYGVGAVLLALVETSGLP